MSTNGQQQPKFQVGQVCREEYAGLLVTVAEYDRHSGTYLVDALEADEARRVAVPAQGWVKFEHELEVAW